MLRARSTHWFEIITTRQDFALVMQEMARTGTTQLEAMPLEDTRPVLPRLEAFHEEFDALEHTFGGYWPSPNDTILRELSDPIEALEQTLTSIKRWARLARPVIARLQALQARATDLRLVQRLVTATGTGFPFAHIPGAMRDTVKRSVYFLPGVQEYDVLGDTVLSAGIAVEGGVFVIALAESGEMTEFDADMDAHKAVPVVIPDFLPDDPTGHAEKIADALERNKRQRLSASERINWLSDEFRLPEVLSQIAVLKWLYANIEDVQATDRTIRITGWTKSQTGAQLRAALDDAGANYVLSIAELSRAGNPPMYLSNPGWMRAFEFFPRMMGVPDRGEADPSVITALLAPLMFGFMFGDVGQGAVLVLAGFLLRREIPLLTLLIPGGISAMIFGVVFGSVFSREDIIPPLWLHPLHEPTTVLAAALVMGVAFLVLGIALDFMQALWQGAVTRWLAKNGGIVVAYVSLLLSWWVPALLWGLPAGILLAVLGARDAEGQVSGIAIAAALGEFVESLMRLFVSSVSFSRVGAFALAHAGLSAAIIGIADAVGSVGYWVVLLLGNALIIGLEGLVTGIQTTRLILFEFFTRFFHAGGREFRPLDIPDFNSRKHEGSNT